MKRRVRKRFPTGRLTIASRLYYPYGASTIPLTNVPQNALNAASEWLLGAVKLPKAKSVILECHAAAREAEGNPVAQASARAIGQCASTIHSAQHCIGLAFYGAIAVAFEQLEKDAPFNQIEQCAAQECRRMEAALRSVAVECEQNPAKINWKC